MIFHKFQKLWKSAKPPTINYPKFTLIYDEILESMAGKSCKQLRSLAINNEVTGVVQ